MSEILNLDLPIYIQWTSVVKSLKQTVANMIRPKKIPVLPVAGW